MSSKIMNAMVLVSDLNRSHGVKQKGGKLYTQVVHRMEAFRTVFGLELGVDTSILVDDGHRVVIKAIITDGSGLTIGSGMAEEIRGQGHVNQTSALENCETSAVGRALASIGLSGGEYASANEMDAVPRKQANLEQNQVAAPASVPSAPAVNPSPTEPSSEPVQADEYSEQDNALYKEIQQTLAQFKKIEDVDRVFSGFKARLKEVKSRNPARAGKLVFLFNEKKAKIQESLYGQ